MPDTDAQIICSEGWEVQVWDEELSRWRMCAAFRWGSRPLAEWWMKNLEEQGRRAQIVYTCRLK